MIPVASTSTSVNDAGSTAGTVKAFRLFGVPVRLHFTFILLVVFVAVSVLGSNQSNASYAIFLLGGLVSVLLHEMGHAVVAARFGIRTVEIVMFPIGGLSRMERSLKPAVEIWVSLAGPLVNILLAAGIFGYMISCTRPHRSVWRTFCSRTERACWRCCFTATPLLAGFNPLPAFPWTVAVFCGLSLRAARRTRPPGSRRMGRMLWPSAWDPTGCWARTSCWCSSRCSSIWAAQESVAALGRTLTQGIPIRAAMVTEFHTLDHGNTIRDAANLLLPTAQQDFR